MKMNDMELLSGIAEATAIVFASLNDDIPESIHELRKNTLETIIKRANAYSNDGFMPSLLNAFLKKKAEQISGIMTKSVATEIARTPRPRYDYNEIVVGPYDVPEEEIIIWSLTSFHAPLIPVAQKRYEDLFEKIFGVNIYEYISKP